jgi:hypothetical protein
MQTGVEGAQQAAVFEWYLDRRSCKKRFKNDRKIPIDILLLNNSKLVCKLAFSQGILNEGEGSEWLTSWY